MGNFRFTFEAVGGHGCERDAKEGQAFSGCNRMGCPDCEIARFVEKMTAMGMKPVTATVAHWPETESEVIDDYAPKPTDFADPKDQERCEFASRTGRVFRRRARNDFFKSNPRKVPGS